MLEVTVEKQIGDLNMKADFVVERPVITALIGKSGAGKTTLANMLAGLVKPDRGRIVFNGTVFFDGAAGAELPPEKRGVG